MWGMSLFMPLQKNAGRPRDSSGTRTITQTMMHLRIFQPGRTMMVISATARFSFLQRNVCLRLSKLFPVLRHGVHHRRFLERKLYLLCLECSLGNQTSYEYLAAVVFLAATTLQLSLVQPGSARVH